MAQMRVQLIFLLVLVAAVSSVIVAHPLSGQQQSKQIAVRGRIVILDQKQTGLIGFEGADGRLYRFLEGDLMAAIFEDDRVRERQLQITGVLHKENRIEIVRVQSVRGGKLYDLYYFCDVCHITAYAPGPCPCCREELEFRETISPEP